MPHESDEQQYNWLSHRSTSSPANQHIPIKSTGPAKIHIVYDMKS